jgi:hypothetical protein
MDLGDGLHKELIIILDLFLIQEMVGGLMKEETLKEYVPTSMEIKITQSNLPTVAMDIVIGGGIGPVLIWRV